MPLPFPASAAAIVGRPAVHDWRCTISFSCSCGQGKPLLITSADQAAKCDSCGDVWALQSLSYTRNPAIRGGVELVRIPRTSVVPTSQA